MTIVNKTNIFLNNNLYKIIPLANNAQLVEVDNRSFLSSYIMNTDSFYLHRKVIEVLPSVNMGIETKKVIKLNSCKRPCIHYSFTVIIKIY